ncbi:MAG: T9SS type A sorting domain-containing protein [Bacteroidia bacterium]|nr:T9SS type A sorting domain-containing protein [Bacteroidia bacterium]
MAGKCNILSNSKIILFIVTLSIFEFSFAQNEITWKDEIVLDGTFKYIRLCKVTKGPAAGDIIMTYFKNDHSAPFGMRRSKDEGRSWSDETIFMKNTATNYYVNPGILQLDDGRLMLSYCKRANNTSGTIPEQGPCVKFSSDGGYTWGTETFIAWGGDYEPTAIQVPNDKNGDGNNDIYLFWSMAIADQSMDLSVSDADSVKRGFACGVVASYDNGSTWNNFMPTKLGARIVHRNLDEPSDGTFMGSKGNMPTPVLLPNHRIGVVCEAVDKKNSPWFTVSDSNDWDWANFQGQQWSSYTYFGYPPYDVDDENVYPTDRNKCWRPTYTDDTFGGAPYTCVLPNGKIAFSQNTNHIVKVFVGDAYAKNTVKQADPWVDHKSFYSCIIPLNDHEVIVAAHDPDDLSKAYIRIGEIIKDTESPTSPENVTWVKNGTGYKVAWTHSTDNIVVHKYEIFANEKPVKAVLWDNSATIEGLDANINYTFSVRAMDYQGNFSGLATSVSDNIYTETVNIFPNPANNRVEIVIPWEKASISVYNSLGELKLHDSQFSSGQFTISTLGKGLYIIQIQHKSITLFRKLLKL